MKKLIIIILLFSFGSFSCKKFLTEAPKTVLTPENSYHSLGDWQKTLNAAYSSLQYVFMGKYEITLGEFGTDEVEPHNVAWAAYAQLQRYTYDPSHPFFYDVYVVGYQGIKRSNIVIGMPVGAIDDSERLSMIAQAKFLRAVYYFQLVKLFGGVSIWTSPNFNKNEVNKPRSSSDQVYQLIVQDLKDADAVLPTTWTNNADKGRATKYAAEAILARVYLQWGKPAEALTYCNLLDGRFHLYPNLNEIFDPAHKNERYENIFEIQFKHSGNFGLEGSIQTSYWGPRGVGGPKDGGGWDGFGTTQYLYNSFKDIDKRKKAWFWTEFKGVQQSPPTNKKFYDKRYANVIEDDGLNFTVIRYADILLMKAEALNDISATGNEKYDAINKVRSRAGLSPILSTDNLSKEDFATAVLRERFHELFGEHLRRWDLIRFGKLREYMKERMGITVRDYQLLYPIPQNSMDANPELEQNPGY